LTVPLLSIGITFISSAIWPVNNSVTGAFVLRTNSASYRQIWCMKLISRGDLVGLLNLFSVDESHSLDHFGEEGEAA